VERVGIVLGVGDDLAPRPQGLLAAHHVLGDPVLLLSQERRAEERHRQHCPRAHVVRPVVPPLLEADQAEVLRAVRERLAPPAVVAAVGKEEEVGHAIVTKAKEVVEARYATMA
jgi:hypothetical protein